MMVAGALMVLLLVGQTAGEDEDTIQRKAEAGEHLARGNAALKEGDPRAALEAYRAAYDAFPSPKIFFNMAEAHRELGELAEAADRYEQVIAELPADSTLVSAAQERLSELDPQLGRLSVSTEPAGAQIQIAGKEAGESPVSNVRVSPGTIEVTATLGATTKTDTVELAAGESREVAFDLVELVETPPPPPPVEEEYSIAEQWWFWTAIGVAVVAGTAAAVVATTGDDFRPTGELGTFPLADWKQVR
jgi:hypothetical protein